MDTPTGTSNGTSQVGTSEPDHLPGLSVEEAAQHLGVSANTVRRWVKAGTLQSERVPRPQGYSVRVHLPEQVPLSATSREVPTLAPDQARAEAMTRYNEALLRPLVEELAETRRRLEMLASENGRLQAELSQARERLALVAPRDALNNIQGTEPTTDSTQVEQHANGLSGVGPIEPSPIDVFPNGNTAEVVGATAPGPKDEHAAGEPRGPWGRFLAWLYG